MTEIDPKNLTTKQRATLLLREYDHMRSRIRIVERELAKACTEYGRECGIWGFQKDHLRIQLQNEEALTKGEAPGWNSQANG